MIIKTLAALTVVLAVTAAVAGCSEEAGGTASPHASATSAAVTAHGTGSTVGSTAGHAPTSITVPLPEGTNSVDVTVTCPGSEQVIVTNASSSTNRHGTCGQNGPILMPITAGTPRASLDVLAFTGGKEFTVRAIPTTKTFHQDTATTTFCAAYSTAYSVLFDADLSYQKHLSTQAQWDTSRTTATSALQRLAAAHGTPSWASTAVTSITAKALTASAGKAATADGSDTQFVAIRCDDNSSSVAVNVTVPDEG
jgi:hypothetical protein